MYCPNCGTENAQSQKFCRRCGANLLMVDLAREFISEAATGKTAQPADTNNILKITMFISIFGFLFITIGTVILSLIQYTMNEGSHGPPQGLFLAMFGYTALVLIVRRLLKLLETTRSEARPFLFQPSLQTSAQTQPPAPMAQMATPTGQTNRNLGPAPAYHSITEQETQQFQGDRRTNQ